jgi:hypothetical protein
LSRTMCNALSEQNNTPKIDPVGKHVGNNAAESCTLQYPVAILVST